MWGMNDIEDYFRLSAMDVYDTESIPLSTEVLTKEQGIENMAFSDVTFVSSHNSAANSFAAEDNVFRNLATNQHLSVYKQLNQGVRGLLLDIEYKDGNLICVHGFIEFSLLKSLITKEILPFLQEDKDAIITIDFETKGDVDLIKNELQGLLEQIPDFRDQLFRFNDDRWENHTNWPTIAEMRSAMQRILILVDHSQVASNEMGVYHKYDITVENHWQGSLDSCSPRFASYPNYPWSTPYITGFDRSWPRLFTMNHFCCSTGIESLHRVNTNRIGGGDNGWGVLYPRTLLCVAESKMNHKKPNFIVVDWTDIGDVLQVADYWNFGGRLGGIGNRCESGLDCATQSCSILNWQCQCNLCANDESCKSGCNDDERCVTIEEGVNMCITLNVTDVASVSELSNAASDVNVQLLLPFLFLLLRIVI